MFKGKFYIKRRFWKFQYVILDFYFDIKNLIRVPRVHLLEPSYWRKCFKLKQVSLSYHLNCFFLDFPVFSYSHLILRGFVRLSDIFFIMHAMPLYTTGCRTKHILGQIFMIICGASCKPPLQMNPNSEYYFLILQMA